MPKPEKSYPVRLAGARSYQAAIGRAAEGDVAQLLRENGNPYDADAIVVVDGDGATLGYIPRDSWLRCALIDEGKGARAAIATVSAGDRGVSGVTIAVTLTGDGAIGARDFVPAD
jgi:hypothetical protein